MTTLASSPPAAPPARGAWFLGAPLLIALVSAAGVAVAYRLFVGTGLGQSVDTAGMRGAQVDHPRVVEVLSRTLDATTLVSLALVCLGVAAIGVLRRRVDLAVGAGLLVIGANVSTQLLKMRLDRPDLDGTDMPNSFPSGHTTAAAAVAFVLILVLPAAVRGTVALLGAVYVTVIAVATVWAEWHRPSDTVAALLVVLAWGGLISFGLRAWRLRAGGTGGRRTRYSTRLFGVTAAIAAGAGALGLGAVVLSERVLPDLVSMRFTFATGAVCIVAAVAVTFLVWTRLAAVTRPSSSTDSTEASA